LDSEVQGAARARFSRTNGFGFQRSRFCEVWRNDMKQLLIRLWRDEEGQDLTEYALLLVLLTLAAVGSLGTLANAINGVFLNVASNLSTTT
jgi:pilus assembly protein Flp/PilA